MWRNSTAKALGISGVLLLLAVAVAVKGCGHDHPTSPAGQGVALKIIGNPTAWQAKAEGVRVTAEGLNEQGLLTGDLVEGTAAQPTFPLDVPLLLYSPPCRWRITVIVTLSRDPALRAATEVDVCRQSFVDMTIRTFEAMFAPSGVNPLSAPASANAGDAVTVSCGPVALDAPDSATYPPAATLSEIGGASANGPIGASAGVTGSFPDPYPLESPVTQRVFTCVISDGRSPTQTFTAAVLRIVPTPTATTTTIPATTTTLPATTTTTTTTIPATTTTTTLPASTTTTTTIMPATTTTTRTTTSTTMPDADGDGISDASDNCPANANTNQANADSDALGDVCDTCSNDPNNDLDGDGVCGDVDNCPANANADQADGDGDNVGDVCDNCPADANLDQKDTDGNGEGDVCQTCEGSTLYAGYCWYLSDWNQSCTQVCASHGGVTDGHIYYTGSGGTLANCYTVARLIHPSPGPEGGNFNSGTHTGCFIWGASCTLYRDTWWTTHDGVHQWANRVCSCAN